MTPSLVSSSSVLLSGSGRRTFCADGVGPADALDIEVVLLAPVRRHGVVAVAAARGVAAGDRAVILRVPPVLQPHRRPAVRGEARGVAGREDVRDRRCGIARRRRCRPARRGPRLAPSASSGFTPVPTSTRSADVQFAVAGFQRDACRRAAASPASTEVESSNSTPWCWCSARMSAPVSSSQARAMMRGANSITVTSMPSSAADAAASSPIRPAPITTRCLQAARPALIARACASVRR